MLLGIDVSDSVNEGASVGKAFAQGFADGFDFDTIKDGLLSGIGNLFSSAGKLLPGGKSADLGSVVSAAIIAKAAMPAVGVGKDVWTIGKGVFGAQASLGGASLAGTVAGSTATLWSLALAFWAALQMLAMLWAAAARLVCTSAAALFPCLVAWPPWKVPDLLLVPLLLAQPLSVPASTPTLL